MQIKPRYSDVAWGIKGGLLVAFLYCAWVTVIYVLHGSAPFERQGVSYIATLLLYIGAGAISGTVVGCLRPLIRFRLGAYFVGIIAAFPIGLGTALLVSGNPSKWGLDDLILIPLLSLGAGIVLGSELRKTA